MIPIESSITLRSLLRLYPARIAVTWSLTLVEMALFAALPLAIGWSIDGLVAGDAASFVGLCVLLGALLSLATGRRLYDTRAYGTIRVDIGRSLAARSVDTTVSRVDARVDMARELVDFLEELAPQSMTAVVQMLFSIVVLFAFDPVLAFTAIAASVNMLLVYTLFSRAFYGTNSDLNGQRERQVDVLASLDARRIDRHFRALRRHEVRLSDLESLLYFLVLLALLAMLAFNLWFATTRTSASAGEIFSIVTYSYELVQSSLLLPFALQTLTRLREIEQRIAAPASSDG